MLHRLEDPGFWYIGIDHLDTVLAGSKSCDSRTPGRYKESALSLQSLADTRIKCQDRASVSPSICLYVRPSICLYVRLSVHLYV